MTAASLTAYTITLSIPALRRASCCSRYCGICFVDHVGVKAPGNPSNTIDLSRARSAKLCFCGGNPKCRSTEGSGSPTEAKLRDNSAAVVREKRRALGSIIIFIVVVVVVLINIVVVVAAFAFDEGVTNPTTNTQRANSVRVERPYQLVMFKANALGLTI